MSTTLCVELQTPLAKLREKDNDACFTPAFPVHRPKASDYIPYVYTCKLTDLVVALPGHPLSLLNPTSDHQYSYQVSVACLRYHAKVLKVDQRRFIQRPTSVGRLAGCGRVMSPDSGSQTGQLVCLECSPQRDRERLHLCCRYPHATHQLHPQ